MLLHYRSLRTLFLSSLWPCLLLNMAFAQPGGKKGGGNEEEPPIFRLPPLAYEVDVIPVPGMGRYYDTNDYGVTVVSMRPDWDPYAPLDLRTSYRASVAAVVFPMVEADGSLSSQVVYLDQEIDPALENIDLTAATKINNQGHITCLGNVYGPEGSVATYQGFLLTPKTPVEAEEAGYSYDIEPLQMPEWADQIFGLVTIHMSDASYDAMGELGRPNLVYLVGSSDGELYAKVIHYADGRFVEPVFETTDLSSGSDAEDFHINASGTTLVPQTIEVGRDPLIYSQADYLLTQAGQQVFPQHIGNWTWDNVQLHDLANNGYACGEQVRQIGTQKVRGTTQPVYEVTLTYHTPTGAGYFLPLRSGMALQYYELVQINDQLINQVPVVSTSAHALLYPGYDSAYLRELMSPADQLEYDGLRFGESSNGRAKMTTPRTAGVVDHQGAPSFYQGAYTQSYPDGTGGFAGIYVIHGTRTSTP